MGMSVDVAEVRRGWQWCVAGGIVGRHSLSGVAVRPTDVWPGEIDTSTAAGDVGMEGWLSGSGNAGNAGQVLSRFTDAARAAG